jgi:hypothetical protein
VAVRAQNGQVLDSSKQISGDLAAPRSRRKEALRIELKRPSHCYLHIKIGLTSICNSAFRVSRKLQSKWVADGRGAGNNQAVPAGRGDTG